MFDVSHRMALVEGRQFDSLKELRQAVRDDAISSHVNFDPSTKSVIPKISTKSNISIDSTKYLIMHNRH